MRTVKSPLKGSSHMKSIVSALMVTATVAAGIFLGAERAPAAASAVPYVWQNCTHVHTKYRHGVGKVGAHDRTTGTPVTMFYRRPALPERDRAAPSPWPCLPV